LILEIGGVCLTQSIRGINPKFFKKATMEVENIGKDEEMFDCENCGPGTVCTECLERLEKKKIDDCAIKTSDKEVMT